MLCKQHTVYLNLPHLNLVNAKATTGELGFGDVQLTNLVKANVPSLIGKGDVELGVPGVYSVDNIVVHRDEDIPNTIVVTFDYYAFAPDNLHKGSMLVHKTDAFKCTVHETQLGFLNSLNN